MLGCQLHGSGSLYKTRGAAAIHRHLVFGRWAQPVQANGSAENPADCPDTETHLHVVGIVAGLYQLFATGKALSNAIRIREKFPNVQRPYAVKCKFPVYFHASVC